MRSSSARRKYLPTLSDLVDRLSIVQLKAINIAANREAYKAEMRLIEHDIDLVLQEKGYSLTAGDIRAVMAIMLTNHFIWVNESRARDGKSDQDKLLKLTHSVNGSRNTAKNKLAQSVGDRQDFKIDAFAAELVPEFGQWNLFE